MKSENRGVIGIVGGVGPYAGLDLNQKIFASTKTEREQDHFQVFLLSSSSRIGDRTEYLLNPDRFENPGIPIYEVIEKLSAIGADVVGIPCNTSHCQPIFDLIEERMKRGGLTVRLLHMIRETYLAIRTEYPQARRAGLLATQGTYHSGIYSSVFSEGGGVQIVVPEPDERKRVHDAIYHPDFGIKNHPNPIRKEATTALTEISEALVRRGADAIIMGCTEIPLAMRPVNLGVPRIDTTMVLAQALIREAERGR